MKSSDYVSCRICEKGTTNKGTRMCDGCWEVDRGLDDFLSSEGGVLRVLEALTGAIPRMMS